MIRIQEHLDIPDADSYLDGLSNEMWDNLNRKLANNADYRQNSLIKKLDKLIIRSNEDDYLVEYANNDDAFLDRQKEFYNFLQHNNYEKLKALITSRPEQLLELKEEIHDILEETDLFVLLAGRYIQTGFGTLLIDQLFSYNNFRKSQFCFELLKEAGFENVTCPYCNDNAISIIDISATDDTELINKAYMDLDHFYPKSQHPFFALSFYNLIPSCSDCNSREKGNKSFCVNTHNNPYHKSFNLRYQFDIDSDFILKNKTNNLFLSYIDTSGNDYTDQDLRLSIRYNGIHLNRLNEFIGLYMKNSHHLSDPTYLENIKELLLQRVPLESKDILKKERGKMYRDIAKKMDSFGVIKD